MYYKYTTRIDDWYSIYKIIPSEVFLVDRTLKYCDFPNQAKVYCTLDSIPTDAAFEDCCLDSINKLRSLQPFRIAWSGGLDSTLVLQLCLHHNLDFEVYLNDCSKTEHPTLYKRLLQSDITLLSANSMNTDLPVVTGELGDQMFGSDLFYQLPDKLLNDVTYAMHFFEQKGLSPQWAQYWFDVITTTSPVPLLYVYDFFWWYNFNFKYQSAWFRGQMPFQKGETFKQVHYHFFDSLLWQRWSCSSLEERRVSTIEQYKTHTRQYLTYLGDGDYAKHKRKIGNYPPTGLRPRPAGINDDLTFLKKESTQMFRYGPLTWASIEDDSGNYYYSGSPPVGYDKQGIPIDEQGLQCLDLRCPVHPNYQPVNAFYYPSINDFLPSVEEWEEWFKAEYISIDTERIQREIIRWYLKQKPISKEFEHLARNSSSIAEIAQFIFGKNSSDRVK